MSSWLKVSADMLALRTSQQLIECYVRFLTKHLALTTVHIVVPEQDGRHLVALTHPELLNWEVDDFEHPFSHVIQSHQMVLLQAREFPYWSGNPQFAKLLCEQPQTSSVLILPLPEQQQRVMAIVVMLGDLATLQSIQHNQSWHEFNQIFVQQWQLLGELSQHNTQRSLLRQSLLSMRSEQKHQQLIEQLQHILIGQSESMRQLRKQTVRAAQASLTVLIQGETGTGKELVATALHQLSERSSKAFVAVNCAAIPEQLLESELFGYEKGAFSGAIKSKQGIIAEADGGTLFLDEIGDMPLPLQAKLLRVLETHQYRPVGGNEVRSSDFRLLAATHVQLLEKAKAGLFRQDLYFRICQYPLSLPPLREREGDLERLVHHFVAQFNQVHQRDIRSIHYQVFDELKRYAFPGNVRELKHLIEFGCSQVDGEGELTLGCFGEHLESLISDDWSLPDRPQGHVDDDDAQDGALAKICDLKVALRQYEKQIICTRLKQFQGDRAKAAQSLGVPKRTLAHKCQKLEIED
ncbi:sigma-54 interaction domain-containing protein [Celerinatantimonas yamalensis]|uniref:Sigma 54-interacting transcriptional regulator n=1 Tax=Celerinatantimonas yamalensis TaxID=559956 RepID=A0ABW9G444_9GAMM